MYFDPPQRIFQTDTQGAVAIEYLKEFCRQKIIVARINDGKDHRSSCFKTFTEFVCYFRICKVLKTTNLTIAEVVNGINNIRMKVSLLIGKKMTKKQVVLDSQRKFIEISL